MARAPRRMKSRLRMRVPRVSTRLNAPAPMPWMPSLGRRCRSMAAQTHRPLHPAGLLVSVRSPRGTPSRLRFRRDQFSPADPAPKSVVTSLAGFATRRPQPRGGRTGTPAAFRYPAAVSRRIWTARSMRRSDQPSFPNAMICCFFSSLKTFTRRRVTLPSQNVLDQLARWPVFR
jgi:hypothetical protein